MRWFRRLDQQQRVGALVVAVFALLVVSFAVMTKLGAEDDTATTTTTTTVRETTTTTTEPPSTVADDFEPRPPAEVLSSDPTTTTTAPVSTSSTTSTTVPELATLTEGDEGPEVAELQELLNEVTGSELQADGIYGPATVSAVSDFQLFFGLPSTGDADHDTRTLLADLADSAVEGVRSPPAPGSDGADGCQVVVIGDSLIAGDEQLHEDALGEIPCAATIDAVSARSLRSGRQCFPAPAAQDGTRTASTAESDGEVCSPAGLELLESWSEAASLGDVVVIALGTNDALGFDADQWRDHWERAVALAARRPVVFLTTRAQPGSAEVDDEDAYSATLRTWCSTEPQCVLADWARTPTARDAAMYADAVHLRDAGTSARAEFIRDVVATLVDDIGVGSITPPTSTR